MDKLFATLWNNYRAATIAAAVGLVAVVGVGGAVLLSNGSGSSEETTTATTTTAAAPAGPPPLAAVLRVEWDEGIDPIGTGELPVPQRNHAWVALGHPVL